MFLETYQLSVLILLLTIGLLRNDGGGERCCCPFLKRGLSVVPDKCVTTGNMLRIWVEGWEERRRERKKGKDRERERF